ncbi:hypothetical protein CC2G_008688 [Coprinopsis cinerea AmutBmut pab1-1]|nr:hypothetical protein CC2G_008688 [Coprinopsis cinerea AmutBmut pab1-1]
MQCTLSLRRARVRGGRAATLQDDTPSVDPSSKEVFSLFKDSENARDAEVAVIQGDALSFYRSWIAEGTGRINTAPRGARIPAKAGLLHPVSFHQNANGRSGYP